MRRVAVIADSHFDRHSRWEECVRVHDWIADDMARRKVDLILHAGDVTEGKTTPDERMAVARWLTRCAATAPMVIVRGNHDPLGELPLYSRLETIHPITVEEGAGVHHSGGVHNFVVGCLAWPTKASVLAMGAKSHAEGELLASDALRNVLRGLGQEMASESQGCPRILLAHAMVRGSATSTGQPLVGCDLEIGVDDLALAGADFVALGHIHKPQEWSLGSLPTSVVYPGSPRRTAFGETEEKGYVLVEIDDAGQVTWERVATPCAAMVLVEDEWKDGNWASDLREPEGDTIELRTGCEVRFRYLVPADQRDAARAAAERWRDRIIDLGVAHVKLEPVIISVDRARMPEIVQARTLREKLVRMWERRGTVPPAPRDLSLLSKAADLEAAS